MSIGTRPRLAAIATATLSVALVVGACAPGGGPSTASPTQPAGSGTATCPSAPAPRGDLTGWGAPATAPQVIPVIINGAGQLVCGPNRMLFTMVDATGRPIGAPDRTAKVAIYNLGRDPNTPIATSDGTFVWAIEDRVGIYVLNTTFTEAGQYGAEFTTAQAGGAPITVRLAFDVQPASKVVKVGDRAPASKTPTLADVGGDATRISTDTTPMPALYETSVDEAIANHQPFVLIFATPKFCTSAQCGPTLDRIKPYVSRYPSVTFINVEPYRLKLVDGVLTADVTANGQLQAAPVTDEWRLLNEPSVYVVNRDGIVTANFELIFSEAELTAALEAVK